MQTRRRFLGNAGLSALGMTVPFARFFPAGLVPVALAQDDLLAGKDGLVVLNDRPVNAETPAHLLDDAITPASRLFVRNNGVPPDTRAIDAGAWRLEIAGESCIRPTTFSLAAIRKRFRHYTYQLHIECGGNGRSEFHPPAAGNQWTTGAIGCPRWTGVRLADVLDDCGIADDAVYVGYYGADRSLGGNPDKPPISRGVPMSKALQPQTLLAWALNDEPLPSLHGFPLRLICSGWPASTCGKWLRKLVIRDRVHDGPKMGGASYRVPCRPVAPGAEVDDEDMCIIEAMPVKSLITFPRSGARQPHQQPLALRGHAWVGDSLVRRVHVSHDFGQSWQRARLRRPANRLAWQRFKHEIRFPQRGYYEIWARATDAQGRAQPMVLPGWNPKGYLNNACHRIAVEVV